MTFLRISILKCEEGYTMIVKCDGKKFDVSTGNIGDNTFIASCNMVE